MKFLLSGLLLASFLPLSSWSVSSDTVVVTQTSDVSVMEGKTLTITCCWTGEFQRGRVSWIKDKKHLNTTLFISSPSQGSLQKRSDCFNFTFVNITRADSGRYICNLTVELPRFYVVQGKGTVITVTDSYSDDDYLYCEGNTNVTEGSHGVPTPVIISLAVIAPLLLLTLFCFYALRRKQARAPMVIYEVPHIDSDVAEMDKHSTSSSRGSSQWCQVPVYESCDYFQRVQDKDSG